MKRTFLLCSGFGFVVAAAVSACTPAVHCGSSASSGTFSIGSPVNFSDAPPNVTGGTLKVDLGSGKVVLTYPDEIHTVEFGTSAGGIGGLGGGQVGSSVSQTTSGAPDGQPTLI